MYRDSRDVDVLIFLEHRDREFEVVTAVARQLRKVHGLKVAVASSVFHPLVAAVLVRPKVIVSTSLALGPGFVSSIFERIYGTRAVYVYMNWEQILSPLNVEYRRPRDPHTREVAKHFAWGQAFADFLIANGVPRDHVFITGKPSLALLQKKARCNRDNLKQRMAVRFGIAPTARWLFFPMTCHFAFFSDYHVRSRIGIGSGEETVMTHRRYVSETIDTIFRWVAEYESEARRANTIVVLRPHPSVSVDQYVQRFELLVGAVPAHVRIVKDMTAHDWLVASDACYTNYSSLALDGNCLGRPAYLIEPQPFPPFLEADWFEGLPRIRTAAEFRAAVTAPMAAARAPSLERHVDGRLDAIPETARRLAEFAADAVGGPWSLWGVARGALTAPRRSLGSVVRWGAQISGLRLFVRPGLRPDWFTAADVRAMIQGGEEPTDVPAVP